MTHYRHFASLPIEIEELDYAPEPSVFLLEPIQDAPGFACRYQRPTNSFAEPYGPDGAPVGEQPR